MDFKATLLLLFINLLILSPSCTKEHDVMCNPVIWADLPDPDVIRVGDDFYMVTTTMHLMPGGLIMHSKDLVNWERTGYLFDRLEENPRYDLKEGTVYGKGQWATSLKYHDGKFYALHSPNDEPYKSFLLMAESPEGPWEIKSRLPHFHDCSLFFDDDGRVFVAYGSGEIRLRELKSDLSDVKDDGFNGVIVSMDEETKGLHEGSRLIKKDGAYYLMIINWPEGKPRRQLCYRAENIEGPYERKVVLEDNFQGFPYVAQGTLVDDVDGNWWAIIFQDHLAVGRVLTLSPVRWEEGWPVIGNDGKVPETFNYVKKSEFKTELSKSDDFNDSNLGMHWQWNHNPDLSAVSLSERPGFLRLKTTRPVDNLYMAPNTLTQFMTGPECSGAVVIDISNMKEGDVAGFGAFNGHSALLSVVNEDGRKILKRHNATVNFLKDSKVIDSVEDITEEMIELGTDQIYLKIDADFNLNKDLAYTYYSIDGENWTEIGKPYQMRYDWSRLFMGQRFAIYNYATQEPGGYIDIDRFWLK